MKLFTCPSCRQTLHFENVLCTGCGHGLAYLPERATLTAVVPIDDDQETSELIVSVDPALAGEQYRWCGNQLDHQACNWAVRADDDERFCRACRLNEIIPDLSHPAALAAWLNLEQAKRRLLYTLMALGMPVESRRERPEGGLAFSFMEDEPGAEKIFTGHSDGLITINIAEADAPFREQTRQELGEAYRTLLGHFRHEIGHYYWDRLIKDSPQVPLFRELFGDFDADYDQAAQRHYGDGPPADWQVHFVTAYASMHPWEDWAESWAHYLHMVDTLETARSFGLALRAKAPGERAVSTRRLEFDDFDDLSAAWIPLTVALNSLNRSMGLGDLYPFVLSETALRKLRFVHEAVEAAARPA
ncbi:MAG TPA: putative zinc-binding peptidase [Polyangia bacterium]|jgi:hypothetical protein